MGWHHSTSISAIRATTPPLPLCSPAKTVYGCNRQQQRQSDHITRKTVQNIFRAFDFAKILGVPFNISVVIQLHETPSRSAASIFADIRDRYRAWQAYRARRLGITLAPMYVFTCEAPGNPHVNWVLRIPPRHLPDFRRKLPRWIARSQGALGPFDLDISDIDPDGAYKALANYIVKGCDPSFLDHFHLQQLHAAHGPQGTFWGKRAGISPAFNKAARAAVGYDEKRRRLKPSGVPRSSPGARSSSAA